MKGTKYPEQQDEVNVVLDYILPRYSKVIIMGDSAGGNIVLSALLKRRDEKKTTTKWNSFNVSLGRFI